jgi:hypothetical protein
MVENNAVEQPVQNAPEVKPEASQENEAEKLLADKDREIEFLREKKEQYRKGMLKAKSKLEPEYDDSEDLESLVERKVQEKLFDAKIQEAEKQKDEILQKTLKENAELKQLAKSKGLMPFSMGSNQDKPEVTSEDYFSPQQVEDLTKRAVQLGMNPEKYIASVKQNLKIGDNFPGQAGKNA